MFYYRVNATYEENMDALVDDGKAMAAGMFLSIGISLIFCMLSTALVSWSALKQVPSPSSLTWMLWRTARHLWILTHTASSDQATLTTDSRMKD